MRKFGTQLERSERFLELFRLWDSLVVTVDRIRDDLTDPSTKVVEYIPIERMDDRTLISYKKVCMKALAVWKSFGKGGTPARLQIQ